MNTMKTYRVYDQTGSHVTHDIEAASLADAVEAGRDWMEDGNWSSIDGTIRIGVKLTACVRPIVVDEDGYDITSEQDATDCSGSYSDEEPACESDGPGDDDGGHDWRAPHALVGGIRENPGVWSCGGTMQYATVCGCCGRYRTEVRAVANQNPGEPSATVTYSDADEASQAWLVEHHEDGGFIPAWLARQLDRPVTERFTLQAAREWVAEHEDGDDLDVDEELEHVFAALHGRRANDRDREEGLWPLCVAACSS